MALSGSLGPLNASEVVEAVERSETDEGNLSSGRAFPVSEVPLIRQPFGLPPSPEGKAKDQPSVKNRSAAERRKGDHGSHRRSRAFPPINEQ